VQTDTRKKTHTGTDSAKGKEIGSAAATPRALASAPVSEALRSFKIPKKKPSAAAGKAPSTSATGSHRSQETTREDRRRYDRSPTERSRVTPARVNSTRAEDDRAATTRSHRHNQHHERHYERGHHERVHHERGHHRSHRDAAPGGPTDSSRHRSHSGQHSTHGTSATLQSQTEHARRMEDARQHKEEQERGRVAAYRHRTPSSRSRSGSLGMETRKRRASVSTEREHKSSRSRSPIVISSSQELDDQDKENDWNAIHDTAPFILEHPGGYLTEEVRKTADAKAANAANRRRNKAEPSRVAQRAPMRDHTPAVIVRPPPLHFGTKSNICDPTSKGDLLVRGSGFATDELPKSPELKNQKPEEHRGQEMRAATPDLNERAFTEAEQLFNDAEYRQTHGRTDRTYPLLELPLLPNHTDSEPEPEERPSFSERLAAFVNGGLAVGLEDVAGPLQSYRPDPETGQLRQVRLCTSPTKDDTPVRDEHDLAYINPGEGGHVYRPRYQQMLELPEGADLSQTNPGQEPMDQEEKEPHPVGVYRNHNLAEPGTRPLRRDVASPRAVGDSPLFAPLQPRAPTALDGSGGSKPLPSSLAATHASPAHEHPWEAPVSANHAAAVTPPSAMARDVDHREPTTDWRTQLEDRPTCLYERDSHCLVRDAVNEAGARQVMGLLAFNEQRIIQDRSHDPGRLARSRLRHEEEQENAMGLLNALCAITARNTQTLREESDVAISCSLRLRESLANEKKVEKRNKETIEQLAQQTADNSRLRAKLTWNEDATSQAMIELSHKKDELKEVQVKAERLVEESKCWREEEARLQKNMKDVQKREAATQKVVTQAKLQVDKLNQLNENLKKASEEKRHEMDRLSDAKQRAQDSLASATNNAQQMENHYAVLQQERDQIVRDQDNFRQPVVEEQENFRQRHRETGLALTLALALQEELKDDVERRKERETLLLEQQQRHAALIKSLRAEVAALKKNSVFSCASYSSMDSAPAAGSATTSTSNIRFQDPELMSRIVEDCRGRRTQHLPVLPVPVAPHPEIVMGQPEFGDRDPVLDMAFVASPTRSLYTTAEKNQMASTYKAGTPEQEEQPMEEDNSSQNANPSYSDKNVCAIIVDDPAILARGKETGDARINIAALPFPTNLGTSEVVSPNTSVGQDHSYTIVNNEDGKVDRYRYRDEDERALMVALKTSSMEEAQTLLRARQHAFLNPSSPTCGSPQRMASPSRVDVNTTNGSFYGSPTVSLSQANLMVRWQMIPFVPPVLIKAAEAAEETDKNSNKASEQNLEEEKKSQDFTPERKGD